MKAFQLAASVRGEAADMWQTLPDMTQPDFESLSSALEMGFGLG